MKLRITLALAIVCTLAQNLPAAPIINNQQLLSWGLGVQQQITSTLAIPNTRLFAETASLSGTQSGGAGGKAYLWPMSAQFRVQNSLARFDPITYAPILREFSDQLYANYGSTTGGYRSAVISSSDRYYDDNAHLAVALAEAYNITRDPIYLTRAKATYNFVLSGETTTGGGGIYWRERDYSFKDTISTLQGARAALMLHQATADPKYLADATRLYTWAKNTTQTYDGLFMEKLYLTGSKAGTVGDWALVNSAGMGISANLEFYDSTHNSAYLKEAQRIATRSLSRYFDTSTGRINDEGYWAYELVDALDDLYLADHNTKWLKSVNGALQYLHNYKQDPKAHYGLFWGRNGPQISTLSSWNLNDQAPVARAYLHTAQIPEPRTALLLIPALACLVLWRRPRT
ncbi:MAG: AGE family epimerase/isomerase [Planctomycetota bacterium]|nr:AGE family epimerase/isomerase [Planctomycetota bacterium]